MQEQSELRTASPAKRKRVVSTETGAARKSNSRPPTKRARLASGLSIQAPDDSKVLEAVESKYDVQIHSVISSSKIQKKVSSVLCHLSNTYALAEATSNQKSKVSVLRAKASDAGKLVSIAEIAKREMAGQDEDGTKGLWFQYIGLGQEVRETHKEKTVIEETISDEQNNDDDENESGQDDFEYMKTPFERAIEGRPKKHAVAIISIFLSRISVDELKRRYGEQTSEVIPQTKS